MLRRLLNNNHHIMPSVSKAIALLPEKQTTAMIVYLERIEHVEHKSQPAKNEQKERYDMSRPDALAIACLEEYHQS